MAECKILVVAGSAREGSYNKQLAYLSVKLLNDLGFKATFLDLRSYPLPIFDGDIEKHFDYPESAIAIKGLLKSHEGLLIASPEYNGSVTGLLKNVIDWVSRSENATCDVSAFQGKVAGLMSASTGKLGGLRGLVHLRAILSNIGVTVIPNQVAIPSAATAFDDHGNLKDASQRSRVHDLLKNLGQICCRMSIKIDSKDSEVVLVFCCKM